MPASESTKYRFAYWSFGILVFIAILLGSLTAVYKYNNRIPDLKIPTHSVPKDNALDYFVRAAKMAPRGALSGPLSNKYPPEEWTNAELLYWYRAAQPAIAMARLGITKPCVQKPVRGWSDLDYSGVFANTREAARTLSSAAYACYRQGDYGKAADYSLDAAEIGAGFGNGGALMTALVANANFSLGVYPLEDVLPNLDSAELDSAARRLEIIKKKVHPWREVVREEGYSSMAGELETLRSSSPGAMFTIPALLTSATSASSPPRPMLQEIVEGISYVFQNKRQMVSADQRFYEQLEKEADEPYTGQSKAVHGSVFSSDTIVTARPVHVRMVATIEVLRTYVAVLRYHKAIGHYPKTLADLVPHYLPSVPVDPFGGASRPPLRYWLKGTSFLLYSVGSDMKDNGGTPTRPGRLSTAGDLVAGRMFERYAPPRPKDHKDLPG